MSLAAFHFRAAALLATSTSTRNLPATRTLEGAHRPQFRRVQYPVHTPRLSGHEHVVISESGINPFLLSVGACRQVAREENTDIIVQNTKSVFLFKDQVGPGSPEQASIGPQLTREPKKRSRAFRRLHVLVTGSVLPRALIPRRFHLRL